MPKLIVRLNGTRTNPFRIWGFERNPFPASPRLEHARLNDALALLSSRPMPTEDDLLATLRELGSPADFTALCAAHYEPGKITAFCIEFPDAGDPE